jgi:hypothetical protein
MNSNPQRATTFPPQVAIALALIATDFLLSTILTLRAQVDVPLSTLLIPVVLLAVLYALWLYGLYRRLNWLRWLTVGGALVGILYLPWAWRILQNQGDLPLRLLKYVLFDAGAILLCLPQANRWYVRAKATA